MEAYTYLAQVYDELMIDVDYIHWATYLHAFLQQKGVNSILEVGCGTGNISNELERLGYEITASDKSHDMLKIASERARKNGSDILFVWQDMCSIEVGNKVDAVVCACDGPNYINEQDISKFAASSYNALKKQGLLLFDISTKYKMKDVMDGQVYYDDGDDAVCVWNNTYDESQQALLMDVTLFVRRGDLFERFYEHHTQYAHQIESVKMAMLSAGYANVDVFDCFTNDIYKECSERVQFVCSKE